MKNDQIERKKIFLEHNSDYHQMMEDLKVDDEYHTDSFRDVFLLGMCYAVFNNLDPIELQQGKKKQSIRIGEVINKDHLFLIRIVAYSYTKDYAILSDDNKCYEIAEKFANAGLKEISEIYYKKEDYPSFKLSKLILDK